MNDREKEDHALIDEAFNEAWIHFLEKSPIGSYMSVHSSDHDIATARGIFKSGYISGLAFIIGNPPEE